MKDKIAICAIAKNENLYIRDWIEYHKKLGIDKIFLYDNNDINGEHFESVIKNYIDSKYVTVFNKRGIEKGLVYNKNNINLQCQCYIDTYNGLKTYSDFQWIFFIDVDEYINIKKGNLKEYLNSEKFNNYDTIVFPWVIYDDNNKLKYEKGSLIKRFPNKSKTINDLEQVKCCVRIGKNIKDPQQFLLLHFIILDDEKICYESGNPVDWLFASADYNNIGIKQQYKFIRYPGNKINECNITINHYRYKTLEEYLLRQYKRHWGSTKHHTNKPKPLSKLANDFFKYNEKTPEKEQIIKDLRTIILKSKLVVNLYYKNNNQIINLLNQVNNQVIKPTHVLIHITEEQANTCKIKTNDYKFKISYYYNNNKPNYPDNTLIKENNLKYKITLNDNTHYDDQFLKTLIIKSLFN